MAHLFDQLEPAAQRVAGFGQVECSTSDSSSVSDAALVAALDDATLLCLSETTAELIRHAESIAA
ncbi:MAG TPA: hypothetical protein VGO31_12425, partial [Microbacteriaceae bacterium]|nr:hypothetical protein [Microbacteriaceae bacterium]